MTQFGRLSAAGGYKEPGG